jgi:hypothetical protein
MLYDHPDRLPSLVVPEAPDNGWVNKQALCFSHWSEECSYKLRCCPHKIPESAARDHSAFKGVLQPIKLKPLSAGTFMNMSKDV